MRPAPLPFIVLVSSLFFLWAPCPAPAEIPAFQLSDGDILALVRKLGADAYADREAATEALTGAGVPAIPFLMSALENADPEVRTRALGILQKMVEGQLVPDLGSAQPESAYNALKSLGPLPLPYLLDFEQFTQPKVQYLIARLLATMGSEKAVRGLVMVARHSGDPARRFAIRELARRPAIPALLECVEDGGSEDIEELAAEAVIDHAEARLVPELWRRVHDPETLGRGLFLRIIVSLDPSTPVGKLLPYLEDRDEMISVRAEVAHALGQVGGDRALQALSRALEEMNPLIAGAAARELAEQKSPFLLSFLQSQLASDRSRIRRAALTAIAAARLNDARPDVEALLRDPDRNVRLSALDALGELGSPHAVPAMIGSLADLDPDVRTEAVMTLRKIGGPSPVVAVAAVPGIHRRIRPQTVLPYCAQIVKAYSRRGSEKAFAAAVADLIDRYHLLELEDPLARTQAAITLHRIGRKGMFPYLLKGMFSDDLFVRLACTEHLAEFPSSDSVEALGRALEDESRLEQAAAAAALGKLNARTLAPRLLKLLLNETAWPGARQAAAVALAHIRFPPAYGHLKKLAGEPDLEVRIGVARALSAHGDLQCVPVFLSVMQHGDRAQQEDAAAGLRHFTRRTFYFTATASKAKRAQALKKWQQWWSRNREK